MFLFISVHEKTFDIWFYVDRDLSNLNKKSSMKAKNNVSILCFRGMCEGYHCQYNLCISLSVNCIKIIS